MHPVLAQRGRLVLYLALWPLVGGLLAALLAGEAGLDTRAALVLSLPLAAIYAFVCLSSWYVSRSTPFETSATVRLLATALGAAFISSSGWLLVARGWNEIIGAWGGTQAPFSEIGPTIFGFGLLVYLLSLAVSYMVGAAEHAQGAERRALEGQVLAREAELRSLRSQIDPHFLFNSLHSISALTAADPARARRMCLLLAEFLRESLALGPAERIPLSRELKLAEKYLEIERVRYAERLQVAIEQRAAGECLVPSLLLQPVVENAVTHGIAHVLEGGLVRIVADASPTRLTMVVESPCDPDRPARRGGGGVGLANVRARLRALYGVEASLNTTERDAIWRVEITLPVSTA